MTLAAALASGPSRFRDAALRFVSTDARGWLLLILLVAAALRVYHYDYDVGRTLTYDTETKISHARSVAAGQLEPRNWKQPYFLPYAGGALLYVAGLFSPVDFPTAERLMTLFMIALAVGTVFFTYLAAEAAMNRRAALLAAALLAVVPIHVTGSRYIKEDMPVVFFTYVALYFVVRTLERGGFRDCLLSGLAAGWAIGSKYSAVLLLPVLGGVIVHRALRSGRGLRGLFAPEHLLSLVLVPLGWACFNPYALVEPGKFIEGFAYQVGYSGATHHDGTRVDPWQHLWSFYFKHAIVPGLTVPVAFASLAGLGLALGARKDERRPGLIALGAWTLVAYVVFERATAKPFPFFARYILPIIPSLCILAAWALSELATALRARLKPKLATLAVASCVAVACLWPFTNSALISAAITNDTREVAAAWIDQSLPRGSKLALDDSRYSPRPDKRRFRPKYFGLFRNRLYDKPVSRLKAEGYTHVVLNNFRMDRFRIARSGSEEAARAHRYYSELRERWPLVREFRPPFGVQTYGFHNPVIEIYDIR